MQVFFKALLDLFDAIDEMLADEEGRSYRMFYAKEAKSLGLSSISTVLNDEKNMMFSFNLEVDIFIHYISMICISLTFIWLQVTN